MISFNKAEIDLEPWERSSKVTTTSSSEAEANLMTLIRNMLSHVIIPTVFGTGLLDKFPSIVQDVITLDEGIPFFLMDLPIMTPWPGVARAHLARRRLWSAMDEVQTQLDKKARGEETDYSWGDLDDVSEMMLERNRIWRGELSRRMWITWLISTENGFDVKERGDLMVSVEKLNLTRCTLVYYTSLTDHRYSGQSWLRYHISPPGTSSTFSQHLHSYHRSEKRSHHTSESPLQ
jgi:hypothetical protein